MLPQFLARRTFRIACHLYYWHNLIPRILPTCSASRRPDNWRSSPARSNRICRRLDTALRRRLKPHPPGLAMRANSRRCRSITAGAAARLALRRPASRRFLGAGGLQQPAPGQAQRPARWRWWRRPAIIRPRPRWPAGEAFRGNCGIQAVRQQLHFRTLLAVNNAYYQVREAETQAFYGLLRAEMEATGLDDLLHRFILILTRTFRAQCRPHDPAHGPSTHGRECTEAAGAALLHRRRQPR